MPSNVGMEVRQDHENVYQQTFSDEKERVDDAIEINAAQMQNRKEKTRVNTQVFG
mgnify:FL=1